MSGAENYFHTYNGQAVSERTLVEIAFNYSPIPKALVSREGKFLDVNQAFCKFIGYDKEELCDMDFTAISHPEDVPLSIMYREQLLSGSISALQMEQRYLHKGGETLWGRLHIASVVEDSEPLPFLIAQIVDMTNDKVAEDNLRRLKSFYDNSSEGIAIFDVNGYVTQVNAAFEQILGYSEAELIGKHFPFNPANAASDAAPICAIENEGKYVQDVQLTMQRRDGELIWVNMTTSPIRNDAGVSVGMASIVRDITKSKLAEQKLSQTTQLYNMILESSTDIITYGLADSGYLYVSPSIHSTLGYEPAELLGKSASHLCHPDDVERVVSEYHKVMASGSEEGSVTARVRHKNGNYRWFETKTRVRRDGSNAVHIISVSRDVSEEMHMQESLEHALRIAKLGHWDWDLRCDSIVYSQQARDILGIEKNGVINYEQFLARVHPEDRTLVAQSVKKAVDIGTHFDRIFRVVRTNDGSTRYLHSQGEMMVDEDGVPVRMVGAFQDITEQRLLEQQLAASDERYQLLVENSLDGIGVIEDGIWAYLNKAGLALFGAAQLEELVGRRVLDFVHPDYHEQYAQNVQALYSGETVRFADQRFCKLSGEVFYLEVVSTPMGGKAVQVVFRDITEREKTNERLLQSEKLSAVGQLAASIAHEVRNPLTALRGFTQILHKKSREPNRRYFTIMLGELDRIEMILNEMLVLAKPQSVTYQPHDIELVLQEVITLVTPQSVMKSVSLELDFAEGELLVLCDPSQLKQVFINVIKNAIEAMPLGGTVKIKGSTMDGKLQIDFVDEGEGIPEDSLRKLGEPFFTTKERGTGLGLMVSHRIVTAHNGGMDISSQLGVGTTVRIVLPLHGESGVEGIQL
ncbi:PAS domain-containing protein [Alicyclobacillus sp. ALC3]|uniref:PAS domain-containing protein n=1 Tax=Alicyclobacillus sp. ALC3 TaxID=2796143 RepID=UPI002379919F|nr:PAS domain S-box protein [Alicyclobacillus sp. ALC3]WDL99102.1 PAS domain S-box protein [Alicyclobacillus sp. ALC3]